MPTARMGLAAVTGPDGRIFVIGGNSPYSNPLTVMEIYNPSTDSWSSAAPLPSPHYEVSAALGQNGRIYAMGGYYQDPTTHEYNPATNSWTTVAPMLFGRYGFKSVTALNGKIYAIGGERSGGGQATNIVEAYNPATNTWQTAAFMPAPRGAAAATLGPDGRIYVFGGYVNSPGGNVRLSTAEVYDPALDSWTPIASMSTARGAATASLGPDGLIYVIGGDDGVNSRNSVEAYNPLTNSWTSSVPPMSFSRTMHASTSGLDGDIYVFGGVNLTGAGTGHRSAEALFQTSAVPEPGAIALLIGLASIGLRLRLTRSKRS